MRKFFITLSVLTIFTISAVALLAAQKNNQSTLPVLGQVPDFTLMDSSSKEFTLSNLQGKVFITDFIFTTCSGICPMMTKNLKGVYEDFKEEPAAKFVSISVNPEYDSPKILNDYAQKYGVDGTKWHFLTGKREVIQELAVKGFKIGSVEDMIFHSSYMVLADKKGQIRGYYDGTKPEEVNKLKGDIRRLLKEKV